MAGLGRGSIRLPLGLVGALGLLVALGCGSQAPTATGAGEQPKTAAPEPSAEPEPAPELVYVGPGASENTQMDDFDFGLSDSDYWTNPRATMMQVFKTLSALKREVIGIGAPRVVAIDQRDSLPLVAMRCAPFELIYNAPFDKHGVVVFVELERNRVAVGPIANEADLEPRPPVNPDSMMVGTGSELRVVDLRNDLGLEWQPSTVIATVIARDQVSNRVRIELGKAPGAYHDEEVERFLAAQAKVAEPRVSPPAGSPLPSYERRASSPEIPAELGVALATNRVVVNRAGATSLLHGSFRLPVREHERVKAGSALGSGRDQPPTAIVGITLVIAASDQRGTAAMRLDVPSWDPLTGEQPVVTGHFTIDLLANQLIGPAAQTYFVYALSGEQITGPAPTALVDESQLPGR